MHKRTTAGVICKICWKGVPYNSSTQCMFPDEKRKSGLIKRIKKQIDNFEIKSRTAQIATN